MRTLFIKIFLWFWLAIALVILAQFISFLAPRQDNPNPGQISVFESSLHMHAESASEAFARDGRQGLIKYLDRLNTATQLKAFLFSEQGEELSGRTPPPEAREFALAVFQSQKGEWKPLENTVLFGQFERPSGDKGYVFVAEMPRRRYNVFAAQVRRWRFLVLGDDPRRQLLRVFAMLMAAGVGCYWLARYISSPVVKLRAATQRLADGDLSARIGSSMGRRKDELAQLGRDFDVMASRIESLLNSQRRLLTDISHELRSPLARLIVALELARQRAGESANGALDRIGREAERLNEMIGQLISLSRWESNSEEVRRERVNLADLVREVAGDADFEAKGQGKRVQIVESSDIEIIGTETLIWSAVENVVRNAVRYTAEGTTVDVTLTQEAKPSGAFAVIRVRDHGAGVPDDAVNEIFKPFYRVADARDRRSGGTGLGLSIAERAVMLHGGEASAANAPDGGLIVELRLPVAGRP